MSKARDEALRHHAAQRVAAFHDAFDVKVGTANQAASRRRVLHEEEHHKLFEALARAAASPPSEMHASLEAVARELADVMVVAYGTADLLDIDLDAAFDAVMDSNMAKLPRCGVCNGTGPAASLPCYACHGTGKGKPIRRADQKILKPPGWREPDLSGAVR